jgi:hypothetical protein
MFPLPLEHLSNLSALHLDLLAQLTLYQLPLLPAQLLPRYLPVTEAACHLSVPFFFRLLLHALPARGFNHLWRKRPYYASSRIFYAGGSSRPWLDR